MQMFYIHIPQIFSQLYVHYSNVHNQDMEENPVVHGESDEDAMSLGNEEEDEAHNEEVHEGDENEEDDAEEADSGEDVEEADSEEEDAEEEDSGEENDEQDVHDQEQEDRDLGNNRAGYNNIHHDRPLYHGAGITVGASMLVILTLLLNHNLTMTCISDIIIALEAHCLHQGLKRNSLFKFRKYFNLDQCDIIKHYYCKFCNRELRSVDDECPSCPQKKNAYFVQLPFVNQLKEMYARNGFYNRLQWRFQRPIPLPGHITDIYDGRLYQMWMNNGFLSNPDNISFSWYTDGIPVFKSSKTNIWPLYLTINELPFEERKKRENTLLLGYWFGDKKPHMNMFIYKFRESFEQVAQGIEINLPDREDIIVRGVLLMGTCDLPAKSDCLNFIQFNGAYGCPTCLCRGESVPILPRGSVHVYPYEAELTLRTSEQCVEYANDATPDRPIMGVKGHTAFSRIMPDFITGSAIDRMHGGDAGVTKKLMTLLFDPKYRNCVFSLHAVIDQINCRLTSIRPPKFIHRIPRSVNDLIHWKASEFRVFCFHYAIPVLEGIMRFDYLEHFLRFVTAVSLLSSDLITQNMIDTARDLLHRFVQEFQVLYGAQFCSINIHQLLHLPDCVLNLGPLWAYTCYEYEDLNGQLLKLIHGTTHIDTQIAHSQYQFIKMIKLVEALPDGDIRDFCLRKKKQVRIIEQLYAHCYSVGTYKDFPEVPAIVIAAMRRNNLSVDNIVIQQYFRLLKNNKLYVSKMYKSDNLQTQSSVVQYTQRGQDKFGRIYYFMKVLDCACGQAACNCARRHYAVIREIISDSVFVARGNRFTQNSRSFLHKCHETNIVNVVSVNDLVTPCFYMKFTNDQAYVSLPVNKKELE